MDPLRFMPSSFGGRRDRKGEKKERGHREMKRVRVRVKKK
jgi:hypothetical protein